MLSVFRLPTRRTSSAASLLLLGLTLALLMARHVTVGVEIGSAEPAMIFAKKLHTRVPVKVATPIKTVAQNNGPGGSQPWVRWSYIP